ncbi:triphosphoribosyl-dephospho-CoA synthase [Methanococcoides sp. NM1]|uniref:triphosphoribosyl-dephospho-CoA synthase n=1 Tax=Methanococcoides sp. NM1 TaxID=1201013 RepID=UPI0010845663|nr:triphosphoribosyl-dephospho-CoA synthase [Methanococcoides sp. NM1]
MDFNYHGTTSNGLSCSGQSAASYIARCAQLAMILEVSASPKPGNIDRHHDYDDTRYEHFLASAVSIYPVIEDAARGCTGIGESLKNAVCQSNSWQAGGNTHFGAFLLLIPLSMAAGELLEKDGTFDVDQLISRAQKIVRSTDTDDALDFYKCFSSAGVRVNDVDEFDLQDEGSLGSLKDKGVTLYDLMVISQGYDQIANEWVNGFKTCADCAYTITRLMTAHNGEDSIPDINQVIVYTFLKLLSENPDTFIRTKTNIETAENVSMQAKYIISKIENNDYKMSLFWNDIESFDTELLDRKINPGSTADMIIAGIFITLLGGLRF